MQLKAFFPRDGSAETPPHPSADFRWKDYCPMAFGRLREVFNIEAAAYMQSVCGELTLTGCRSSARAWHVLVPCVLQQPCSRCQSQCFPRTGLYGRGRVASSGAGWGHVAHAGHVRGHPVKRDLR